MNKLVTLGIIPARYASTRFPGKPLAEIKGISMIERVYKQCLKAKSLDYLCVATDDERIFKHVSDFGGKVFMTSENHQSGTDRCLETTNIFLSNNPNLKIDIIINIQGDEPLINPDNINKLAETFTDKDTDIATLGTFFISNDDINNPNSVKIVRNKHGNALYFSRAIIPFLRNNKDDNKVKSYPYLKHIGVYAYKYDVLKKICSYPQSSLEKAESLEQLRWLENGFTIKIAECESEGYCVDVPEDILKIEKLLKNIE